MKRCCCILCWLSIVASLLMVGSFTFVNADNAKVPEDVTTAPVGTRIDSFELVDHKTQKSYNLAEKARDAKATVVLFLSTSCPVSKAYTGTLPKLMKQFDGKGVQWVSIFSHLNETSEDVLAMAKEAELNLPLLKDTNCQLANKFLVDRLPIAYVLDANRFVRYRGRIDDQYAPGVFRGKPTTRELSDALEAVLNQKEVPVKATASAGCLLSRDKQVANAETTVTYHKDISRIIQKHCQDCHRPGEIGPFKLMSYKDAKSWADMMREVVSDNRMPPWHADPSIGKFHNDRRLSDTEKKQLLAWVDQGCPEGESKDAPEPRKFSSHWNIGEPDEVLKLNKEVKVPAQWYFGGMPYQYVLAGEKFTEDKWVTAFEARPDNRGIVHHMLIYVIPGDAGPQKFMQRRRSLDGIGEGLLGAFAPGDQPTIFPDGCAKKISKGSQLLFQMHYTPNGKAGTDRSMVALKYAKEPAKHEMKSRSVSNNKLSIPAHAENHEIISEKAFEQDAVIIGLNPHMHLRGKDFKYELVFPDGKRETILYVPKYDFNWQTNYNFSKPIEVVKGTKVVCTAHFDNSSKNPFNPDPKVSVRWGEQTWDEMMIGFVDYYFKK